MGPMGVCATGSGLGLAGGGVIGSESPRLGELFGGPGLVIKLKGEPEIAMGTSVPLIIGALQIESAMIVESFPNNVSGKIINPLLRPQQTIHITGQQQLQPACFDVSAAAVAEGLVGFGGFVGSF